MTSIDGLLSSWRDASTQSVTTSVWIDGDQWWTPAVDAVVDALAGLAVDADAAARSLGRQRATTGVDLDTARLDVLNVARLAGATAAETAQLVDALTLGWVDGAFDSYFTDACVDPLTELASLPYLLTRLSELYAEGSLTGNHPIGRRALIVVAAAPRADPIEAETQLIAAQVAMRLAFAGGETLARVGPHCAVALADRREPRFSRSLRLLREELNIAHAERRLPNVRLWVEPLPALREDLPLLIGDLAAG